ncbi:MAG: M20/M25/M40 family metallo-hydrolase [Gemmatimonadaceae bacterium]|nr:M20/M25/M40 family metallo-hydrolase [Gemmatimonadaceae bacterium]
MITSSVFRRAVLHVAFGFALLPNAALSAQATEPVDTRAVNMIVEEGTTRSQVMDISSWLSDVHGARLTGSPSTRTAADWAVQRLTQYGLSNVKLESWGPFGRGWRNEALSVRQLTPQPFPIIATVSAWTPGTNGVVTAEVVHAPLATAEDLEKYRGKLRGKIVLISPWREVAAQFKPLATRYSDSVLASLSRRPNPRLDTTRTASRYNTPEFRASQTFGAVRAKFLLDEGAVANVSIGRGDGGTIFGGGGAGSRDASAPAVVPALTFATEHYGRILRTLAKGIPVTLELNVQNAFYPNDGNSFNIVGEIAGTSKRDEVVMLGAHFDSWHYATGATDNTAGSAVMMEAVRILKALNLPMKRTVRIGLWTGEEQGLLGSRAYVKAHFGDTSVAGRRPEWNRLAGYFNLDNGTGAIRGVYLQGNELMHPIFSAWMSPFRSMGMTTLSLANTGGTDHQAFDGVGLPGFQFIQDEVEYGTRTHHSNMDTYERLQADDMMKNAVIVATFVYHAAIRDQLLPRKPRN